jgi:hypothetical protein
VALYVHNSTPFSEIPLQTNIQAIAIKINIHRVFSICSIYISRSHELSKQSLTALIQQLPRPFVLVGDFNSYNILWGCPTTDTRGRELESFIIDNQLNVLNNGAPTRISYDVETAIDLSIVSPELEEDLQWAVYESPGDSDHCPIVLDIMGIQQPIEEPMFKLNIKKAKWQNYEFSAAWDNLPSVSELSAEASVHELYRRIAMATENSIPNIQTHRFYPKPWWTPELRESKKSREKAFQKYKRVKSLNNVLRWKKLRAEHKKLVLKSKRESWRTFVSTINQNTTSKQIFETIRKIKGKEQRRVHILQDHRGTHSTLPSIANAIGLTFAEISQSTNYKPEFLTIKNEAETNEIEFSSTNREDYNEEFSIAELKHALSHTRNSSPGPDGIYYQMLKAMPENGKMFLLSVINKCWTVSYYPDCWREATIIPVAKPGKNHTVPGNYRPIALTSCIGKTMERMINRRLVNYLEINK